MEPLAKPSGIRLVDHRAHVLAEAERLLTGAPFLARKYHGLAGGADLVGRVRTAAWHHDDGKEDPVWQSACQADYETYRAWRRARGLDPDGVDAADYRRFEQDTAWRHDGRKAGERLMKSGLRHEFASLDRLAERRIELSLCERAAIAAHHGRLSGHPRAVRRWETDGGGRFERYWQEFGRAKQEGSRIGVAENLRAQALRRYEFDGVRALLRLADTRASRDESGEELAPFEPFQYTWPEDWTMNAVQRLALELADGDAPVEILRAPTGSGKTGAALLWGRHQIERGRADRLVVAMPTRFTANALAAGADDHVAGTGLYHSSAWHARYAREAEDSGRSLAREQHGMARLLATPFTVCTVDHLLLALTGSREDHHATFFFLAHAAVVLDEVDFYDAFVQANLVCLLDVLRALDVPVLLMSATVPDSARRRFSVPGDIRETHEEAGGRRRLHRHPPLDAPKDAKRVLKRMVRAGTGIVYANTVERAYRMWQYLRKVAPDDLPVFLYHSLFTEPDKQRIERAVVAALGRDAWDAGHARGIAVFTQIGEMSVNVSAPLMLSDLCPWDRLAQRAGRLARFGDRIPSGDLWVADAHRDDAFYPAPYGSFDPGPNGGTWTVSEPLRATQTRVDTLTASGPLDVTADLFVLEVDRLYPEPDPFDARTRANAHTLDGMIRDNWLILPAGESDEDEAEIHGAWRSRDMPPQTMLLILDPRDVPEDEQPMRVAGRSALYSLEAECGISVAHHLLRRAHARGHASTLDILTSEDADPIKRAWCVSGYERPDDRGCGGGLGALAVRHHDDDPSRVFH